MSSLEKCALRFSASFSVGSFFFLFFSLLSSMFVVVELYVCLCIVDINPLPVASFANLSYCSGGCLFLSCLGFPLLCKSY